jgi:hypothetical protein
MKHDFLPTEGAGSNPERDTKDGASRGALWKSARGFAGLALLAATCTVIAGEFGPRETCGDIAGVLVAIFALTQIRQLGFSVLILVALGLVFLVLGFSTRSDMPAIVGAAAVRSAWVVAMFVSLLSLRSAVNDIPGIARAGRYLVSQPPGRRYAALTLGSQLFSHILQYGAVTLLGGLVTSITAREPEGWLRRSRERRMLLAIQRGFVATLCWSPVAFPMIISTTVIRGSDWLGSAFGAFGTSIVIMGTGWLLDTLFKTTGGPPPTMVIGVAADLLPLALLLATLCIGTAAIVLLMKISISVAILVLVPLLAVAIVLARAEGGAARRSAAVGRWLRHLTTNDLPSFSAESMLVLVATFTGLLSVELLGPVVEGASLPIVPGYIVLMATVWWMPIAGQLGLHPILAASLVGTLLPQPALYGVAPNQLVVAVTAGWATSPFTAITALVARLGRVSTYTVGWCWNGPFLLVAGVAASLWAAFNPVI